jgi:hypothetical protein
MSEIGKTLSFGGAAVVLALLALLTAPVRSTPDAFLDRGDPFFPDFTNPNEATTLEVIDFDEETAEGRPFKVTNQDGLWTIPSHHDYPADGEDQLARTAAGLIGITKDDVRSNNVSDHEACGVLDPLDEGTTSLKGRGKRVTIRGGSDAILADLIVGRELEDRPGFRFVRLPDQKRVYVTKMGVEISNVFQDWIEKDLLKVDRIDIDQVILKDYSIDERTYVVDQRGTITLNHREGAWVMDRMPSGREIDMSKMNDLLTALDELVIVGVRPKPEGLSQSLERVDEELRLSQSDLLSLQSRGYYFARDGSLLSNEGELQARTKGGITYTLRFGEIVFGSGEDVSAGTEASDDAQAGPGENRYLFITTSFDPLLFPEPTPPGNRDFESKAESEWTDADRENKDLDEKHEEWASKVVDGRKLTDELNARFAGWYYVIPADAYGKVRLSRSDLLEDQES